jgi:hypothetical protein
VNHRTKSPPDGPSGAVGPALASLYDASGVAGFLIFPDGRAFAPSSWGYDYAIREMAEALPREAEELREWVLDTSCEVRGLGTGRLDLRSVTPGVREVLLDALERAFPSSAYESQTDPLVLNPAELLGQMVRAYRRGDPPDHLNPHMLSLMPYDGSRTGPGWPEPADDEESTASLAEQFGVEGDRLRRAARAGGFRAREVGGVWYANRYAVGRWLDENAGRT